jgi:NAD(P)-dependent dehydrogenase (short-subunit alcohol dehydrogenase family)
MSPALESKKVTIITGASGGIGAGLAAAFRDTGYAVVGTSLSMPTTDDPDLLAVQGDITQPRRLSAWWSRRSIGSGGCSGEHGWLEDLLAPLAEARRRS